MKIKKHRVEVKLSEIMFRKLLAIAAVSGKTRTSIIEDLIGAEYDRSRKYRNRYYADLEKKVEDL